MNLHSCMQHQILLAQSSSPYLCNMISHNSPQQSPKLTHTQIFKNLSFCSSHSSSMGFTMQFLFLHKTQHIFHFLYEAFLIILTHSDAPLLEIQLYSFTTHIRTSDVWDSSHFYLVLDYMTFLFVDIFSPPNQRFYLYRLGPGTMYFTFLYLSLPLPQNLVQMKCSLSIC